MADDDAEPIPLTYAAPEPKRSFDELLTDFVEQEMREGRLKPISRCRCRLLIAMFILVLAALLTLLALA